MGACGAESSGRSRDVISNDTDNSESQDTHAATDTPQQACGAGTYQFKVAVPPAGAECAFDVDDSAVLWALSHWLDLQQGDVTIRVAPVSDAGQCVDHGWYFTGSADAIKVAVCPNTCGLMFDVGVRLSWSCDEAPPEPEIVELPEVTEPGTRLPCPTGTLVGAVCSPSQQAYVSNAIVRAIAECNGAQVAVSGSTNYFGEFELPPVPAGMVTLQIQGPDWTDEISVLVREGETTDISALAKKQCWQIPGPNECFSGTHVADFAPPTSSAADIIVAVDTSGSMGEELVWVQENLNTFVDVLEAGDLDYRVVLVSSDEICIPPPLGGPGCTSNSPDFLHHQVKVSSTDALQVLLSQYPNYSQDLRPDVKTHFIIVTDDESTMKAQSFQSGLQNIPNSKIGEYVMHSIVGFGPTPYSGCETAAALGEEYLALSEQTAGAIFPVCSDDWTELFATIADSLTNSQCSLTVPIGTYLKNAEAVYVAYDDGESPTVFLDEADGVEACTSGAYYVRANPPAVVLCPGTCDALGEGTLQIDWTCPISSIDP